MKNLDHDIQVIKNSGLFDAAWYLQEYADVAKLNHDPIEHYVRIGAKLLRNPSQKFDTKSYLISNEDVLSAGVNPLVHFVLFGSKEGRGVLSPKDDSPVVATPEPAIINSRIKGGINRSVNEEPVVRGWLAEIGDPSPRAGLLKIDGTVSVEIYCGVFRQDLKRNKINAGNHSFEFIVPFEFVDGKQHTIELIDKQSGKVVGSAEAAWSQSRRYKDFSGFLADSLVSPVINAPFREEDKRCFAIMENVARYLCSVSSAAGCRALVTVIMPVHNRIDTVESAIDSVLAQSYSNIELIIVDDGSTDGSLDVIKKYKDQRIVLVHEEKCIGVSAARNRALDLAKGEYVTYLDSDNTWDQRYISAMVGAFLELPGAEALYSGQLLYRGTQTQPFAARFGAFNKSLLENRNFIDLNAFCHTRKVFERLGGFDVGLRRYVDWDLILRMAEGARIYSIPVMLSNYFYDKAANTITNNNSYVHHLEVVRERQQARVATRWDRILPASDGIKQPVPSTLASHEGINKPVTIVIPSYEALDDIKECIESILNLKSKDSIEIIVVDNASSDQVVGYLRALALEGVIKFIGNKENYGFTHAVNQGIAASTPGNDIVLLNNDALVTPGAIAAMQEAAYDLRDCGLVVPQQVLPGGTKTISDHVPFANPKYDCDVNLSAHHSNAINVPIFHDGAVVEISFAPFFCVYIKRDVLTNSLGLDAEFGRHYRSDRIFCDYVRHVMKLRIYHVSKAVVYHKLQKATDNLRETSGATDDFDMMFRQNKWDERLKNKLGYATAAWDFS